MSENWVAPSESEQEEIRYYQELEDAALARMAEERRIDSRQCYHAEITVASETNFFMGFSENISEGGLFLATMSPPPVGERVSLFIKLDANSEEVEVEGIVRWHRTIGVAITTGCGIQFVDLDPDVQARFESMILNLKKEPLFFEM